MGWRGAIRSFGAMARAAERDARRRAREHAHHLAEIGKIEAKEKAAEPVREFEAFLQSLVSAHRTCSKPIDWQARATAPGPVKPQRRAEREKAAIRDLPIPGFAMQTITLCFGPRGAVQRAASLLVR